jgi:hypothetical protein
VNRSPIVHLLLDFHGQPAPALGTIWDFILADPGVLQCIREATVHGNDVAISAVTGPAGVLAVRPYFDVRQALPSRFAEYDSYLLAASIPKGAAEVRVHLTDRRNANLAILIHRYWPEPHEIDQQQKIG